MINLVFGLLFIAQICVSKRRLPEAFSGDAVAEQPDGVDIAPQPDIPIVNDQPDIVPNGFDKDNDIDNKTWEIHKYIAAIMDHIIVCMGVIGLVFVIMTMFTLWRCKKRDYKHRGYDGVDDETEDESDVEQQEPFDL